MDKHFDVIIVGAGLAGLSAAKELREAGKSFLILEAHKRPGGKVLSEESDGRSFETGPQFVNRDMTEIVALAQEADQTLTKAKLPENGVMIDENKHVVDAELEEMIEQMESAELVEENQTVTQFVRDNLHDPYLQKLANSMFSEEFTGDPDSVSVAYFLEMSDRYLTKKPQNQYQVAGELTDIVTYLADMLDRQIIYESPVIKMEGTKGDYFVYSEKEVYHSKAVIVATPPTAAKRIKYSKELQAHFGEALASFDGGAVIKFTWVYDEPFWYETKTDDGVKAVSGMVSVEQPGLTVADSSTENDSESRLTTFIGGETAKAYAAKSSEEQLELALNNLVAAFGEQAKDYLTVKASVWVNEPYYSGGYSDSLSIDGLKNAPEILRAPHQGVVFAGTEIAKAYPGFMEGAIQSGKYAVEQLLVVS